MNVAIEMHDSSVVEITVRDDGSGFVLLDAVVFQSEGDPGIDDGVCGVQTARVSFSDMTVEGTVKSDKPNIHDFGEPSIYEGSLEVNGVLHDNIIPVPLSAEGSISLKMMLADDARIVTVRGRSVSVSIEGEFRYEQDWRRD